MPSVRPLPYWATRAAADVGLSCVNHGGSGDCLWKAVKGAWPVHATSTVTRANVVKFLKDNYDSDTEVKAVCDLEAHDFEHEGDTDSTRLAMQTRRSAGRATSNVDSDATKLTRYFQHISNAATYAGAALIYGLRRLMKLRGIPFTLVQLQQRRDPPSFSPRVVPREDGSRIWTASDTFKLQWDTRVFLFAIQDHHNPTEDHFVQAVPLVNRACKLPGALARLRYVQPTKVFNEDQSDVVLFDAVRRSSIGEVEFRSKRSGTWWSSDGNLSSLTLPAISALEAAEANFVVNVEQPPGDQAFCAEPVWAIPGEYTSVSARFTSLVTSFKTNGKHILLRGHWTATEGTQQAVVVVDPTELGQGTLQTLRSAVLKTSEGAWCAGGPGERPAPQSRLQPGDIRVSAGNPPFRYTGANCLSASLAHALAARGLHGAASALPREDGSTVADALRVLTRMSSVSRQFDVRRLKRPIAGNDTTGTLLSLLSSVSRDQGGGERDTLAALWLDNHAVTIDVTYRLVYDAAESSAIQLPDADHDAIRLVHRLTCHGVDGLASLKEGLVLIQKRKHRPKRNKRGIRAGRRFGRAR